MMFSHLQKQIETKSRNVERRVRPTCDSNLSRSAKSFHSYAVPDMNECRDNSTCSTMVNNAPSLIDRSTRSRPSPFRWAAGGARQFERSARTCVPSASSLLEYSGSAPLAPLCVGPANRCKGDRIVLHDSQRLRQISSALVA